MTSPFPAPRPLCYHGGELCLSGASLRTLAAQFGTPLYAYSADDIEVRTRMLGRALGSQPHTLCYAVKANSSLALLKNFAALGCGFDIVSGGELERVRRAAPEACARVVFSGVGKQTWELDAALDAGILLFNVESLPELELLSARARAKGVTARFALRVNPNVSVETHPYISTGLREHKFGLPIEEAQAIYRHARTLGHLEAASISVHIGSQIRDTAPFAEALSRVRDLLLALRGDGHDIRYLDAGGGLGIEYTQAGFDPQAAVQAYADALLTVISGLGVHLLLEPGRFLVAQAGILLTRALFRKTNGSKHFLITDAAMNDLIRPALYDAHHEVLPVREPLSGQGTIVDLVGPVCESGDFFAHDRELAAGPGDLLAILDAGAYGMSQSSNYNTRPRPAEILVENGKPRLIRRRETFDDLFATELV